MQIQNLQALRAFAALNVVLFYIIGVANNYGYSVNALEVLSEWGSNGVDLFFVISGFIMVNIQNIKNKSPVSFIYDRLIRIAPTYWMLTLMFVLLAFITPSKLMVSQNPTIFEILQSLSFTSQLLSNKYPVLYVGWTIEIEMLFYVIFAISLAAKKKSPDQSF